MAVFNHQGQWYGSHMPLTKSVHSHQIIFQFSFEGLSQTQHKAFEQLAHNKTLITIVPETFDLRRLMQGTLSYFDVKVYQGHFERGGVVIAKASIKVQQINLNSPLTQGKNGSYYVIQTDENMGLLVHKIGTKPSFDQIFGFRLKGVQDQTMKTPTKLNLNNRQPLSQLPIESEFLTISNQYYLETRDFQ